MEARESETTRAAVADNREARNDRVVECCGVGLSTAHLYSSLCWVQRTGGGVCYSYRDIEAVYSRHYSASDQEFKQTQGTG